MQICLATRIEAAWHQGMLWMYKLCHPNLFTFMNDHRPYVIIIAASSFEPHVFQALMLGASMYHCIFDSLYCCLYASSVFGRLQLYWDHVALCSTEMDLNSSSSASDYKFA